MSDRQQVWSEIQARLAKVNTELLGLADSWPRQTDTGAIEMFRVAMGRVELLRADAEFLATHLEITEDEAELMDLTRRPDFWEGQE